MSPVADLERVIGETSAAAESHRGSPGETSPVSWASTTAWARSRSASIEVPSRLLEPGARADSYQVQHAGFTQAVQAGDPGLRVVPARDGSSSMAAVIIGSATLLTLLLAAVAALGVFNTVVLNTRERRRDLGMLKSIGMTPCQVMLMMVTSMGALGVLGGLVGVPLGVEVHGLVAPAMIEAAQADIADFMIDVYRPATLVLLALAGIPIAVLGALLPSRSAARLTVAEVLHNE